MINPRAALADIVSRIDQLTSLADMRTAPEKSGSLATPENIVALDAQVEQAKAAMASCASESRKARKVRSGMVQAAAKHAAWRTLDLFDRLQTGSRRIG